MSSEVTVIGGGAFGLCCAWALARRGARVRLIEAARLGAGASGGILGALAPHAPARWDALKAVQLEALTAAPAFWAEVAAAGGVDPGFARTGRLQPVADRARAAAQIAAARALWPAEAGMRLVEDPPGPLGGPGAWLADDLSARLDPRRALAALAAALRAAGGVIEEAAGEVRPRGAVVRATGAAGLAAAGLGVGVKGQAARLGLDAGPGAPQLSLGGLHVVPHADGTVAIGSTTERDFADPAATDDVLEALIDRARAALPALAAAPVLERWAGLRPRAASGRPLVGPLPGRPGEVIANGGFKIGFALAPWIGDAVAELVLLGRADRIPPDWRP